MTDQHWPRRKVLRLAAVAGGALVAPLGAGATSSPASASGRNAVVTWDQNAQTAIWDVGQQQPNEQVRSFAIVNGAVYDAVNAIAGKPYQPYLVAPSATGRESSEAAVATAAYQVLAWMFPAQLDRLDAQYQQYLAGIPNGRAKSGGIAVGAAAAAAMIEARRDDGAFGDQTWTSGTAPGDWRPTPPTMASSGAWTAYLAPFLIPEVSAFRAPGPPDLSSRAYAREVGEVAMIGSATSTVRTADQTQAAQFWHDRRSVNWEIKRQLAVSQRLSLIESARLFALVDMVVADAGTVCFAEKERWGFWRPITAIREAGTDGNSGTAADPAWTPLLVTPPFPEYPSGHTCGTGARMSAFAAFFGRDRIRFNSFSEAAGATRHYASFSQALAEVIEARIWGGIHFRSGDVHGANLGRAITGYAVAHHFRRR